MGFFEKLKREKENDKKRRASITRLRVEALDWGGRWDSNPRSPVPQTGALTN